MTPASVCPAYALAHVAPGVLEGLTELERFVLPHVLALWLRPEQWLPAHAWRSCGIVGGRGLGKTHAIACQMNAGVEAGTIRAPGLMAPTLDRVDEVQIAALIKAAPPWFRPVRANGTIRWPNGVTAECHSPEAPGRSRSSNLDWTWLTEIVDWQATTRVDAFNNITTATRVGLHGGRFVYDTTSKGNNELIQALAEAHRQDPRANVLLRGTMFDNPLLSREYLRAECQKYSGQRFSEEILGLIFSGSAGAAWTQATLDAHRRAFAPAPVLTLVAVDPALSASPGADEFGILVGARDVAGHANVLRDRSGHYTPDEWGRIVVDEYEAGAAGVVVERNHAGDPTTHVVVSEARTRGIAVVLLKASEPFPLRVAGKLFVREVNATTSKGVRATGPAAETNAGRVHLVGRGFAILEAQLTTYVDGAGAKSPNRYDAHNMLVAELAGLDHGTPKPRTDPRAEAAAAAELQRRLLAAVRGRRVGM